MRHTQMLYFRQQGLEKPLRSELLGCNRGSTFNSSVIASTINTSHSLTKQNLSFNNFYCKAPCYCKILVLIMGPIIYEAHIE